MYIVLFVGNKELKSAIDISTEDVYAILSRFVTRYISKGICLKDKMKVPIKELREISNQIDRKIIESNVILTESKTSFSASEDSLRTLAYEQLRSRCIRGKELRASFKQLDKCIFKVTHT